MTAQRSDLLNYRGQDYFLFTEPLAPYLATRKDLEFAPRSSANWRGYVARWRIADGQLFLVGLSAQTKRGEDIGLGEVFEVSEPTPVLAEWFTGTLRLPIGPMRRYVHMGYESKYDSSLLIKVADGCVVGERLVSHDWRVALRRLLRRRMGAELPEI